jgi:hypothetical protein
MVKSFTHSVHLFVLLLKVRIFKLGCGLPSKCQTVLTLCRFWRYYPVVAAAVVDDEVMVVEVGVGGLVEELRDPPESLSIPLSL